MPHRSGHEQGCVHRVYNTFETRTNDTQKTLRQTPHLAALAKLKLNWSGLLVSLMPLQLGMFIS